MLETEKIPQQPILRRQKMITEPLTWAQICERYPDQWVCVVEIERGDPRSFDFERARVVGHGETRRAPLEQAEPWWEVYSTIGHYFTSEPAAMPRIWQ